jgi:hypothetical protein
MTRINIGIDRILDRIWLEYIGLEYWSRRIGIWLEEEMWLEEIWLINDMNENMNMTEIWNENKKNEYYWNMKYWLT